MVTSDSIVRADYKACYATFVGTAEALAGEWLILPAWLPQLPKRKSASCNFEGWWGYEGDSDWEKRPPRIAGWHIARVKGGEFELTIRARYFRKFLGGPDDPGAALRVVYHHRRMVRAQRDDSFRRFLTLACSAAEDANG